MTPAPDKLPEGMVAEPFGYWVEQKHADPVLLRKPAYIPEPSALRTVTPLYTHPTPTKAATAEAEDEDGPCTDCYDTGITVQTERACSCDAGDQFHTGKAATAEGQGEVPFGDVLAFLENGFRNVELPELSGADLEDIAGALRQFVAKHGAGQ